MPHYRAFGLDIDSELRLPALRECEAQPESQVRIRRGPVPGTLPGAVVSGVLFQAAPQAFLLQLDQTRILVSDGSEILVDHAGGDEAQMRVLLLGSCFGALLHQRGMLVLHASGVRTARGCVLFAGPSGAGKSTILEALRQRGYPLVSDDLAAIHLDAGGRAVVEPSIPRVRLWPDSARVLGHGPERLQREQPGLEKIVLPAPDFSSVPAALHRVYLLPPFDAVKEGITLEPLAPFHAFRALVRHTYRRNFLKGLGARDRHFGVASAAADQTSVVAVNRPRSPFLLRELADLLETDFSA